jgi:membrane protein
LGFIRLVASHARQDAIALKSAALAFVTILSLIPLLAAFSVVGAQAFDQYRQNFLDFLVGVLPYAEATLMERIDEFLEHAQTLGQLGVLGFILVSLSVFGTIEETINQIWRVDERRPLRIRLLSFTLLLFWGPLLIGSTFSVLIILRARPEIDALFEGSLLIQLLPFLISLLGLTMLYWLVPYTKVEFRSALLGGVTAALLLEGLRRGFGLYTEMYRSYSWIVYGSFALAFLFMISLQIAWWIVLLGSEVSYTAQHEAALAPARRVSARFLGRWIGVAALALLCDRFLRGQPLAPSHELAAELKLPPDELRRAVRPLLAAGLLGETSGDEEGYLLAADPHLLPVERIFTCYEEGWKELLSPLSPSIYDQALRCQEILTGNRLSSLDGLTLAQLATGATESLGEKTE